MSVDPVLEYQRARAALLGLNDVAMVVPGAAELACELSDAMADLDSYSVMVALERRAEVLLAGSGESADR